MSQRAQIFIADWLHAVRKLQITSAETASAVMQMLSLEVLPPLAAQAAGGVADIPLPGPATAGDAAGPAPAAPATAVANDKLHPANVADAADSVAISISRLPTTGPPRPPPWINTVKPLPRAVRASSPPPESLLDPQRERALLGGLAASINQDGGLDVARLVAALAHGTPLQTLPQETTWSTRRGLQVLVDDGPGMAPFRADVERVLARLGALLPGESLSRLAFEGCPVRGCRSRGRKGSRPWRPPERGSAVLLLTDLGIANADPDSARGTVAEWLGFADFARAAGVQLRSLVPYPSRRWPAALVDRLHPVPWDRRTTVAAVRRTVAAAARQVQA